MLLFTAKVGRRASVSEAPSLSSDQAEPQELSFRPKIRHVSSSGAALEPGSCMGRS